MLNQSDPVYSDGCVWDVIKNTGYMFYMIKPSHTSFKIVEDVPNYFQKAVPYFCLFMVLENAILWYKKKTTFRINDTITSLSHGLIQESGRLLLRGAESYLYILIYENYRVLNLSWDSPMTWYLAALFFDLSYYWVHRACHEVHVLWAQHQVHHSSEEFNMAVGLRQSILQGWCGVLFYLPMALFIPPAHFIVHYQFNMMFQFWIHTEAVETLGPFEYIFNTPQHHRVHHGSNLYCLDKNYGGVLIIWDRLFGTFQKENKNEEIIYGLVFNQPSFNPLYLQTFYTIHVWNFAKQMRTLTDKLRCVFYGPSWNPGKPRLGAEEDKVKVTARQKYDVKLPCWLNTYILLHFCIVVYGFHNLINEFIGMSPVASLISVVHFIGSLTVIGMLLDADSWAYIFEFARCVLLFLTYFMGAKYNSVLNSIIQVFLCLSVLFWTLFLTRVVNIRSSTVR